MSKLDSAGHISRRRALFLGGGVAAGTLLSSAPLSSAAQASHPPVRGQAGKLPAGRIQKIVGAQGTVTDGVLSIDIARTDLGTSKPGVTA